MVFPGRQWLLWVGVLAALAASLPAQQKPATTASQSVRQRPLPDEEKITAPELRYRLLEYFGPLWYCDPDAYPVGRPMAEREGALQAFPNIQNDRETFAAIAKRLGLGKITEFSDEQKLSVYREYKKLRWAIRFEPQGEKYKFAIGVPQNPSTKARTTSGFRVNGVIDSQGQITILTKEPAIFTCPICLAAGTRIATPTGPIAVKDLRSGMLVWTLDAHGKRVAQPIDRTAAVAVAPHHPMIHLVLKDGRELWASLGHPTTEGQTIGQLKQDAVYDGAKIDYTEVVPYEDAKTYDLLPAGDTGFYWANGILLASTLR